MKTATLLTHVGRNPEAHEYTVNAPVYRSSTRIFPTLEAFEAGSAENYEKLAYARYRSTNSQYLEEALSALDGSDHAIVFSSGLAAIVNALLAFLKAGDHVLIPDCIYYSARKYCIQELPRLGIECTFYPPRMGADIASLVKPNTRVIYAESPGSMTLEMQDIPALAKVAHENNCIMMADNTWATPLYFKPFQHGVDVSIQSATKYIGGHSDFVMGVVSTTKDHFPALKRAYLNYGAAAAPDVCALALRGLRTMEVRIKQQQKNTLAVIEWLRTQPLVKGILTPVVPEDPGHAIWKRDYTGFASVFSILVDKPEHATLARMMDGLEHFKMGFSWGGYESLMIPFSPAAYHTISGWDSDIYAFRLHVGLEDPADLIADLKSGFARLNA